MIRLLVSISDVCRGISHFRPAYDRRSHREGIDKTQTKKMGVWFLLRYPRQKRASYRRTWTCIYTGNSAQCHCFWDTASAMYHDCLQGCIFVSRDILQSINEQLMEHCLAKNVPARDNRKNFPLSSNLIGSKHQWSTPRSLPRANKKQSGSCRVIFTHARF